MLKPDKSTGCDGKIKYSSRSAAQREVRRIEKYRSKRIKRGRSRLIVYPCSFCRLEFGRQYFHVGHTLEGKHGNRCNGRYIENEEEDIYESIS